MQPCAVLSGIIRTPFGNLPTTFEALLAGQSAFAHLDSPMRLRNHLAAVLPERPEDSASLGQWQRDLAFGVARQALDLAAIEQAINIRRCACIFGTSFGHLLDHPGDDTMSTWARDCSARLGFEQEPLVVGSGCSTGADAIGLAAALLDSHAVDAALVVAADIVTDGKRLAHSLLGTMTSETARPFDQVRSGMLLGEAAGALVLLRKNDCPAARRELIGVGAANDADGLTTPDSSGLSVRLAIERAMHGAGLAPRDIALYLAHGTGTELNDSLEATVIAELFADHQDLTVMGVKGAIGHTLGACGVVEFLLMLEALDRGLATPTPGLEKPIAGIAERFAGLGGRQIKQCCGVSVKLGFGGFNTALIGRVQR